MSFLHRLREKPESTRVKILWLAVVVSTLIIGGVWLWSLKYTVSKISVPETIPAIQETEEQNLPSLKEVLEEMMGSVK